MPSVGKPHIFEQLSPLATGLGEKVRLAALVRPSEWGEAEVQAEALLVGQGDPQHRQLLELPTNFGAAQETRRLVRASDPLPALR